jgi:hypothetical protein
MEKIAHQACMCTTFCFAGIFAISVAAMADLKD